MEQTMGKEESLPVSDIAPGKIQDKIEEAVSEIGNVILGKEKQIRLSLCCLFAGGHLLMEDKPGMGKTTLSQALANAFGLDYSRIQFTSDLLPADILGVTIYDQSNGEFSFHQGPIFSNLVLADEINRTTPKTQSALLEAMEEGQVSIDNKTMVLPRPFFVIATQNPVSFAGTYPLPESQLDRFLMRLQIGYPDPAAERELLNNRDQREKIAGMKQSLNAEDVTQISNQITEVQKSRKKHCMKSRTNTCTISIDHQECRRKSHERAKKQNA